MAHKLITIAKLNIWDRQRVICCGCGNMIFGDDGGIIYLKVYGRRGAVSWVKEYCGPCMGMPKDLCEVNEQKWKKFKEKWKIKKLRKINDRVA